MTLDIQPIKRDGWTPIPVDGCHNVYVKMLMNEPTLGLAMLRFESDCTIHEHDADFDIDVICLEGQGFISLGSEQAPFKAGQRLRWKAGELHRLWTEESNMLTLMVEHYMPDHK